MDINETIKKCRDLCAMPLNTQRDVVRALEAIMSRDMDYVLFGLLRLGTWETWGHWLYAMSVWVPLQEVQRYQDRLWKAIWEHYPEGLKSRRIKDTTDSESFFSTSAGFVLRVLQERTEPLLSRLREPPTAFAAQPDSAEGKAVLEYLEALETFVKFCEGSPDTLEDPWPEVAREFRLYAKAMGLANAVASVSLDSGALPDAANRAFKLFGRIPDAPVGTHLETASVSS